MPSLPSYLRRVSGKGLLITFEGMDGVGKTTAIQGVAHKLRSEGREVLTLREPGGTLISEKIRTLLKDDDGKLRAAGAVMDDRCEALLFAAARAQIIHEVIKPALDRGAVVLVDRFIHSSLAYQGYARGLGLDEVAQINRFAMAGTWPDATVLLELSPEEADRRRASRDGDKADRIESTGGGFMARVAEGYEAAAKANGRNLLRVNADGAPDDVVRACLKALRAELPLGCGCAPGTILCPH